MSVFELAKKRILFLVAAVLVTVVAPELLASGPFEWSVVLLGSRVALGYWIITTFRDYQDPRIENK